jgi:hypothetical protein
VYADCSPMTSCLYTPAVPIESVRNSATGCKRCSKIRPKQFSYVPPDIEEVLVEGDFATERLMWKLTIRDKSGKVLDTIDENGLDVLRRQSDGSWKVLSPKHFRKTKGDTAPPPRGTRIPAARRRPATDAATASAPPVESRPCSATTTDRCTAGPPR